MIWSLLIRGFAAIAGFFVNIGRALGRKEYEHEALEEHDERVAEANAARDDHDAIERVPVSSDPYNRDRH